MPILGQYGWSKTKVYDSCDAVYGEETTLIISPNNQAHLMRWLRSAHAPPSMRVALSDCLWIPPFLLIFYKTSQLLHTEFEICRIQVESYIYNMDFICQEKRISHENNRQKKPMSITRLKKCE